MGISEARLAAQAKRLEVVNGGDSNAEKRTAFKEAAIAAKGRRNLSEVLDKYERMKLSQQRSAVESRRALDGPSGILKAFLHKDIASIERSDIADPVRAHAQKAPIAANRSLAYVKAFLNWCVDQDIIESNPSATIKKPSEERTRDRYHSLDEFIEIWEAMGELGYPFAPLYRLLACLRSTASVGASPRVPRFVGAGPMVGATGAVGAGLYQPAVILTYEDCHSRSLARRSGSGDVVHRRDAPTKSSGRE